MKKQIKRITAVAAAAALAISFTFPAELGLADLGFGGNTIAASAASSGNCGDSGSNVTWLLDDNGTLTISGSGKMEDCYDECSQPWYDNLSDITSVVIEPGVTYIGKFAFFEHSGLTSITIPSSVISIGQGAFEYCSGLTSITIPDGVTSIGKYALTGCTRLTSINVNENNQNYCSVDGVLFDKGKTTLITYPNGKGASYGASYIIPSSVTSIEEWAFYNCSGLTGITIPSSVTSIGESAFYGCTGLTGITIPSSVTSIAICAFVYCRSLTSITIQDGVTSIERKAFLGCTNLASVTIPNSVSSIDCTAFSGCSGLTNITVDSNNPSYCSESGVLFNKDKTTLIYYPFGKPDSNYAIPDGVTAIDEFAFSGCSKLTSITIPSSVNYIGNYAFYNCSGLTIIYIPGGITIRTDAIPSTAAKITYTVDSSNNVTITKIELPSGQNKVDIPPEIDGKTVVAVEEGYQPYVGNHTCVTNTTPTCINKATCGICGQEYGYGDHNISHHDAAAHTCTADGTIEYWECSVCGKYFSDDNGTTEITNIVDPNDPARHSLVKTDAKAPTCTDDGNRAYWTCTECGNIFSDDAGLNPTTLAEVTVSATGHNWSNDWSSDETGHWHTCSGCDEKVDFGAHTEDSGTATVQPTETSTGVMTYYCSVCGYEMRTEEIPATGSNYYPTYPTYPTNPAVSAPSVFTESLAVKSESDGSTATLSWDKAENADKYCVYQYKDGKYVKIKTTTDTSVTLEDLKNGETYKYLIRYMIDGKLSPLAYSDKITVKVYYKSIVSASAEKDSVTLKWNAVPNAEKYAIYKYADGKAVKLAETEKRAAKIIGLTPDTEYQYIVSAYVDGKWTTMLKSDIVTVRTKAE